MVKRKAPARKALSPSSKEITLSNPPPVLTKVIESSYALSYSDELPGFDIFEKELSEKAKSYWNCLQRDYNDFTSWTCLLQNTCENEDNLPAAEAVFKCFLRYYPYCYGYWKKFADIENRYGNLDKVQLVFEKGVKAISISIDLWVHYINFVIQKHRDTMNGEAEIRKLFNAAIDAAGMEFKSNKLWEAYIQWEKSLGNLRKVTEIYDHLIRAPNQQYIKNWIKFKEHLESHTPSKVLPTEEYMKTMQELDILPPGMTSHEDLIATIPSLDKFEEELSELDKLESVQKNADFIRKKAIDEREKIFLETAGEIKKRWKYEEAIKRPYFHVKPLERSQIRNWKEYIEYEIGEGNHKRIQFLFERCMVVCALYEEFWQKYLDYIEEWDVELARSVYSRACDIHLLKNYKLHIKWSVFEEKQKNYDHAAKILANVDKNFPGMILITQQRIGLARRMKRFDEIEIIYENAIRTAERIEDKIFYSIKFSHVLAKFCGDKSKARLVLLDALKLGKKQERLYLQLLELETHYGSVEDEHILSLFNSVDNDTSLTDDMRTLFAERKVEFYDEYGNDIQSVIEVRDNFELQCKLNKKIKLCKI